MTSNAPRPKQHLAAAGKLYKGAWKQIDGFRAERGTHVPDWPDWCFIPIAATQAIVAEDAGVDGAQLAFTHPERLADAARLAALATWRVTQGIYRFDPTLYASVIDTPVERDIPADVLYRLPEWCVYVETPGLGWLGDTLHGYWAHLEHDINTGRAELRLLLDTEGALEPLPLHLGDWPLIEAVERMVGEASRQTIIHGLTRWTEGLARDDLAPGIAGDVAPLLSLLLYLCSQSDEIGAPGHRPAYPRPKRTKRGWRLFPADKPSTWNVGVRIGSALRRAQGQGESGERPVAGADRARPRAHIRRAHWHGYWTGPRDPERVDERRFQLRWQPPIPVNVSDVDDLPATVRPIQQSDE